MALGESFPAPWLLACGVPEGSVLSPMLFNIYLKPLGEVFRGFELCYHQHVDDTQANSEDAIDVLSQCLESVMAD